MSDEQNVESAEAADDNKADVRAIIMVFTAALLLALHFVSGFTFDF